MLPAEIDKKVVAGMTNMYNITYLFSKDLYWRMNSRKFVVEQSAEPSYPRRISDWWFGCQKNSQELKMAMPGISFGLVMENSAVKSWEYGVLFMWGCHWIL